MSTMTLFLNFNATEVIIPLSITSCYFTCCYNNVEPDLGKVLSNTLQKKYLIGRQSELRNRLRLYPYEQLVNSYLPTDLHKASLFFIWVSGHAPP